MKLIQKLSELIDEEIEGAECYIKMAIENKSDHKSLADALYDLSMQEMNHVNILHEQVTQLISEYRQVKGEPPADMLAVYDYLHRKQIEKANHVKAYQVMYKEM